MFTVIPKDGIKYQNDTLNDIESNLTVKKLKKVKSILENFHLIASNRFSPIFYALLGVVFFIYPPKLVELSFCWIVDAFAA
jgi:hypothetical protein